MDSAASQTFIICGVGRSLCSLPLASVVETFRPLPIEPMTGAPAFVLGLAIVRGAPMPVVDLGRLVNGESGTPNRFVVVKTDERHVALAVDSVVGIRVVADTRMQSLPPLLRDADTSVVRAIGTLDSALFIVLQASRIVPQGFLDEVSRRLAS
ncbi:MAG TPA: chemotaxis protein CheW [Bauldia sp.]|nr:chemotaxis protein CheW [Bauldia sp.]